MFFERVAILGICVDTQQLQAQIGATGLTGNCGFQSLGSPIMLAIGNVRVSLGQGVASRRLLILFIQAQIEGIRFFVGFIVQLFVKRLFPVCIAAGKQQEKQQQNDQTATKGNLIHRITSYGINNVTGETFIGSRSLLSRLGRRLCRLLCLCRGWLRRLSCFNRIIGSRNRRLIRSRHFSLF